MIGPDGIKFYELLVSLSKSNDFAECAKFIPAENMEKKAAEELVLRFFAAKNAMDSYKGSVSAWLDGYMEAILLGENQFDVGSESTRFMQVMQFAREKLGESAFLRYRGDQPVGALPPAYFEAVSIGIHRCLEKIQGKDAGVLRRRLTELVQSDEFRAVTGPGANSKQKLGRRIELVSQAFLEA